MSDPLREANELREQLASDKRRIAFLFGGGTSQAVGLPGMATLTNTVRNGLTDTDKAHYDRFLKEGGSGANLEHVLDKIRLCRELIGNSLDDEAGGWPRSREVRFNPLIVSDVIPIATSATVRDTRRCG